ncbi:LysR family transcriptional regulator [Salsuginibacillus kocurii]|uniref:LysR family transcriptional regulator n=1 Tax=Salsuginibacillus kocurii TaxID=427078 RepID=UPI000382C140|nr:LysR family transcriptional regulator [Salsuginibacillus kocurii]
MDSKKLRYFVAIAEEGQITKAAQRLHMAQPPLSQQLKLLEEELGVKLVNRYRRSLELTEAGRVLYKKSKRMLEDLEDISIEIKEVHEGIKGELKIGANKSCFAYLPKQMKKLREQHPGIHYKLREGDTYALSNLVESGEIELAILRLPLNNHSFSVLSLPTEPYVVVTSDEYDPFQASTHTISIKALEHLPLLLLHRLSGKGQYEVILNECRNHGFEAKVVCECPDASMLLSLAHTGSGIAIVPESTLHAFPYNGLKIYHMSDSFISAQPAIVWNKDRYLSRTAERFIDLMRENYMLKEITP